MHDAHGTTSGRFAKAQTTGLAGPAATGVPPLDPEILLQFPVEAIRFDH